MPLFAITANDVDAAGFAVEGELPPRWLDDQLSDAQATAKAPGALRARLSRTGDEIVVRGRVAVRIELPCARCLGPSPFEVEGELSLLLRPASATPLVEPKGEGKSKKPQEYEFTAEEAEFDTYDGDTVVLDPFVREAILLELPNFPLCSEACPGIGAPPSSVDAEPSGSTRPALDPRLAPLGALRAKLGERAIPEASEAKQSVPKKRTSK